MLKKGESGRIVALARRWRPLLTPALVVLAADCQERERLTFPNPGDGIGPVTVIIQPSANDTMIPAGPGFFVYGRSVDPDGVDSVYFFVSGAEFPPFEPDSPRDTVSFGLPITTFGHSGDTIDVRIYGVDGQGNQGVPSTRRLIIQ